MPSPLAKACLAVALGCLVLVPRAHSITIRDDVADSNYIALGAQSTYQAAGEFTGGFGGTLIADPSGLNEYVITATHLVVADLIVPGSTTFTIGGNTYNIASVTSAPNYNSTDQENDLSIVRLSSPVTGVTPVAYYTGNLELNQTITMIGYGLTGTGLTGATGGAGTRRGANNVIDVLDASTISSSLPSTSYLFDFDNPSGTSNSLSSLNTGGVAHSSPTALPLEGALASGDSGGGQFATIGGTLYLVGVNSYIAAPSGNPDATNPNGSYGDIDGATRVSDFSSFIAQTVPEPGSATLLLAGAGALGSVRRRSKRSAA